jgi:ribonuclease HII
MVETQPTPASVLSTTPLGESSWWEFSIGLDIHGLVAGVDEVGRGALFGPVVAAAVILPPAALPQLMALKINDSKKLSSSRRTQLAQQIAELALDWKIGYAATAEIDKLNILQATLLAMKRAILKLKVQPALCLVDGNQMVKDLNIPQQTASIMAKVWRDDLVLRLASKYPMYDIENNKGYGSPRHLLALQKYGPSPLHRLSFRPCQLR